MATKEKGDKMYFDECIEEEMKLKKFNTAAEARKALNKAIKKCMKLKLKKRSEKEIKLQRCIDSIMDAQKFNTVAEAKKALNKAIKECESKSKKKKRK